MADVKNYLDINGKEFDITPEIYIQIPGVAGVAEIDGVQYATLQAAVEAADDGDTVTLSCDFEDEIGVIDPEDIAYVLVSFGE